MMNAQTVLLWIKNALMQPQIPSLSTDNLNVYNKVLNKTEVPLKMLDHGIEKIKADVSLSPAGQTTSIVALATSMLPEFTFLGRSVTVVETSLANTTLFTVVPPIKDAVLRQMRNAEVRDGLRGLNEAERDVQFLRAAQQDQDEVLDALLDAPGGMLCSADMKKRALNDRAKRRQPEAYRTWRQDVLFHDLVSGLRDLVANCVVSLGVDPKKVEAALGSTSTNQVEKAA